MKPLLSTHVSTPVPFSCNEATPLLLSQSLAWFFLLSAKSEWVYVSDALSVESIWKSFFPVKSCSSSSSGI